MFWPWRKRKNEHREVERKLALQERIAEQTERRLRRLEQETDLYRLRRRT